MTIISQTIRAIASRYRDTIYIILARIRLIGRFTTCFAQQQPLRGCCFLSLDTSCIENAKKLEIFDFLVFTKFCNIMMT